MPSFYIGKYNRYTIPHKKLGQNLPWQNWPELILAHFIWQNWSKQCQVSCFQSSIIGTLTMPAHTPSFSPRPIAQIAGISPLHWLTVKLKFSTLPSQVELVHHSSSDSSTLPKILPSSPQNLSLPSHLDFSFLFLIFFFFNSLINKSIENFKNFFKMKF
jgi:hypothetical protein